jgi:hypothetical protein
VSTFKNGLLGAAAFAAVIAGVNVASAATFTYNGYTVANEQNINILTPNIISGGAGQVTLIGADAGKNLQVWCLDIFTYLLGSDTYTVGSLTTAGAGGSSSNPTLTTQQIGEIGALVANGNSLIATPGRSNDISAAIQLAIWKVEYTNFTYTGLDSGAIALAAGYLADVAPGGTWAPVSNVSLLSEGDNNQTMAFVTPLPAALPLFATGLGALGLLGWRRKRKAQAAA